MWKVKSYKIFPIMLAHSGIRLLREIKKIENIVPLPMCEFSQPNIHGILDHHRFFWWWKATTFDNMEATNGFLFFFEISVFSWMCWSNKDFPHWLLLCSPLMVMPTSRFRGYSTRFLNKKNDFYRFLGGDLHHPWTLLALHPSHGICSSILHISRLF